MTGRSSGARGARRARLRRGDDGGFVLVWSAMLMVVLLLMCGFAIDVSNWYLQAQRQQKTADAAALAGVVFMPDSFSTAQTTARSAAVANGYASGVTVTPTDRPSQLRVSVTRTVDNFFGGIVGLRTETIRREAVAEYQGPVPMGTPVNGIGNEPTMTCVAADFTGPTAADDLAACRAKEEPKWVSTSAGQGQFWLHVSTPQRAKGTGDAYQSYKCESGNDGCTVPVSTDYSADGYFYAIRNPSATASNLSIQVFDPASVNVGNQCGSNLGTASTIPANLVPDARYRYASGQASPFCTGDEGGAGVTTFIVRAPDDTPWNNLDNPVVANCQQQFPGYAPSGNADMKDRLTPGNPKYTTPMATGSSWTLAQVFRQWVPICNVRPAAAGDYLLQIKTNVPLSGNPSMATPNPTASGEAGNRFGLRAGLTPSGATATSSALAGGVSVFAAGKLGIYGNADGADTRFYLARVLPDAAGRSLLLRFFDTGDASQAGSLRIVPPTEWASTFSGCKYTGPTANVSNLASSCEVGNLTTGTHNGKWMSITVPIPSTYTCNVGSTLGCWLRVKFTYPSGTTVQDTTSWTASVVGDPVRLVR